MQKEKNMIKFWKKVKLLNPYKTLKELSKECNINMNTLYYCIKTDSLPSIEVALRISKKIGVPVQYLIDDNQYEYAYQKYKEELDIEQDYKNTIEKLFSLNKDNYMLVKNIINVLSGK